MLTSLNGVEISVISPSIETFDALKLNSEPEVYPVISPPWKQIKSPFDQSDRSIKNCPKYLFTTACATDLILTTISKMEEDVMIP